MDSPGSRALPDNLWSARDLYGDVYHLCSSWVGILATTQDFNAYQGAAKHKHKLTKAFPAHIHKVWM